MSVGLEVQLSIETRYIYPKYFPIDLKAIKQFGYNEKVVNVILDGLNITFFSKVIHCNTTKDIWDKLQTIYEGDTKVKRAKLQKFKAQFESLKMKEEENISKYFERIDENVNAIQGIGAELKEKEIVEKLLRPLPMIYNLNISTLEYRDYLDKLIME